MNRFSKLMLAVGVLLAAATIGYATTDGYGAWRSDFLPVGGTYTTSLPSLSTGEHNEFHLDSSGRLIVSLGANTAGATSQATAGTAASGAAKVGNPVMVGGQDGTNAVTILTSSGGSPLVAGDVAHDAVDAGNPIKFGGKAQTYGGSVTAVSSLDRVDANFDLNGALRVVPALPDSSWSITNAAAVNAVATATQAAGAAGVKHVCTGLQCKPWQDATGTITTATGYTVALRDGASGAGTIKWSSTFSFPVVVAGEIQPVTITFPTPIVGTAATAMCVEITSSALLHTGCTVSAQGYDTK